MPRLAASSYDSPPETFPDPQRLMAGWSALPIPAAGQAAVLKWPAAAEGPARLRVTLATDVREVLRVSVSSAVTGQPLGELDMRYGYALQVHETLLSAQAVKLACEEGIALRRIEGNASQWIFWRKDGCETGFSPHLLTGSQAAGGRRAALDVLASLDALQPFGWLEGCVLDGLLALQKNSPSDGRYKRALLEHLACFTGADGGLLYESPMNVPRDGCIYGEEGPLPFAIIAQVMPESPWLDVVEGFFDKWVPHLREGRPKEKRHVGETSYTCAYPLAALARVRPGRDWDRFAALHLLQQRDVLASSKGIWLRRAADGTRTECFNWARAHAWYLLGLARTLPLIAHLPEAAALREEFLRACAWTADHQRPDGLWSVFVHEPHLAQDTSGSAGIAAAFAIGAGAGYLPESFRHAAAGTLDALDAFLTPDGFLAGAAQSNKGGEELQRSPYRVIAQFAQGLHGQLIAALA